jgi:hypothetical protein
VTATLTEDAHHRRHSAQMIERSTAPNESWLDVEHDLGRLRVASG